MAHNQKYKFFILTGDPGVGKTTLVKSISAYVAAKGLNAIGFYTEEVRRNGVREGFDVVSLQGQRGFLARDQSLLKGPVKYKVGKYGVLVQDFEEVALPCLQDNSQSSSQLLIIDEIGKMEFFSEAFKKKVREIFNPSSQYTVLATIPIRKSDMLIENIRNSNQAKVWTVTRQNRNYLQEDILKEMAISLNF